MITIKIDARIIEYYKTTESLKTLAAILAALYNKDIPCNSIIIEYDLNVLLGVYFVNLMETECLVPPFPPTCKIL